jgi:chemotaxis protein methyltransferase CheR
VAGDPGAPTVFAPFVPEISDEEFLLFQSLIRREAGIHLAPSKKPMLVSRLMRRMNQLRIATFGEYYRHIVYAGAEEVVVLLDAICTNETWFFRNPRHFDFVKDQLAPRWVTDHEEGRRARRVRAWSAGCSSGEEAFSLAMVLLDALPGWDIDILATDLSSRVLERARSAMWPLEKSRDIPPAHLKRYMLRGIRSQAGKMKAGPELQRLVSVRRMNLNDHVWSIDEASHFELIFCRNVLMYFDPGCRARTVKRFLSRLAPGGHLFVGDAEGLNPFEDLRLVAPGIYTPRTNPDLRAAGLPRSEQGPAR